MGRKAKKPPALAQPDVDARLHKAAEAAGLTLQQLADLVFEAGIIPTPSPDGITERYTLQDLGLRLWGTMQEVARSDRGKWFNSLVPAQQTAMIVVLRDQGFRTEVIARDFEIEPAMVMRTWNTYASQLGSQVIGIRLDTIAGQLQMAAERSQQMAVHKDDHAAYWRIEKEKVAVLQSLGVVDQAIRRVEVSHKLTDQTRDELDRLVQLEAKKNTRRLEIEELQVTAEGGDELPDDVQEDYDDD